MSSLWYEFTFILLNSLCVNNEEYSSFSLVLDIPIIWLQILRAVKASSHLYSNCRGEEQAQMKNKIKPMIMFTFKLWYFSLQSEFSIFVLYFFFPKPHDECNILLGMTIVCNCKQPTYRRVLIAAEWITKTWLRLSFSKEKFLLQIQSDCQSATVSKKTQTLQIHRLAS